jgi:hypothetical protein
VEEDTVSKTTFYITHGRETLISEKRTRSTAAFFPSLPLLWSLEGERIEPAQARRAGDRCRSLLFSQPTCRFTTSVPCVLLLMLLSEQTNKHTHTHSSTPLLMCFSVILSTYRFVCFLFAVWEGDSTCQQHCKKSRRRSFTEDDLYSPSLFSLTGVAVKAHPQSSSERELPGWPAALRVWPPARLAAAVVRHLVPPADASAAPSPLRWCLRGTC